MYFFVFILTEIVYLCVLYFNSTGWPVDLEFLETWKSQGILWYLKKVMEKSGSFMKFRKVREF